MLEVFLLGILFQFLYVVFIGRKTEIWQRNSEVFAVVRSLFEYETE